MRSETLPRLFGRFVLLRRLSEGGMGEIFLAKMVSDEALEKRCIIKRILPHLSYDTEFVTRFIDEARVVAQLTHGGIAQVFDMGRVGGEYFIAMEFVEGRDLNRVLGHCLLRETPFPLDLALYVVREVCTALAYAHRKTDAHGQQLDLVHRDISPHNILLSFDGEVKLIDFGLAKSTLKAQKTQANLVFGKCAYLAPEQVLGRTIDRRTDIYAIGVVLYELVTGRRLFEIRPRASFMEIVDIITKSELPRPSAVRVGLPPALDVIVWKALARDPAERFGSAEELRRELSLALSQIAPATDPDTLGTFLRTAFGEERVRDHEQLRLAEERAETLTREAREAQEQGRAVSLFADVASGRLDEEVVQQSLASSSSLGQGLLAGDDPLMGQTLAGRYNVLAKIGEGGMGVVFEAVHVLIEKRVAIKVLRADFANSKAAMQTFQREARSAGRIGHDNIVDITDFGQTPDGRIFFVMELLLGQSLARVIREEGSLPLARGVAIGLQISRALGAAHDKHVIHRDLKPENVFITKREGLDGRHEDLVKVLDFGIAKFGELEDQAAGAGAPVVGTPEYMAPEQASSGQVDARTDIYALGVILYEALTGQPPFRHESMVGLLSRVLIEQPVPPRQKRPDIPERLERLVLAQLAKAATARPASMALVEAELKAVLDELEPPELTVHYVSDGPDSSGPEPRRPGPAPSSGTRWSLLVATGLALGAAAVLTFWGGPAAQERNSGPGRSAAALTADGSGAAARADAGLAAVVPATSGAAAAAADAGSPAADTSAREPADAASAVAEVRQLLRLGSDPAGAKVVCLEGPPPCDGTSVVGQTPTQLEVPLEPGRTRTVRLRFVRTGFRPRDETITLGGDGGPEGPREILARLRPAAGKVKARSLALNRGTTAKTGGVSGLKDPYGPRR